MDVTQQTDHQQTTLWNGLGGHTWVEAQELLDQMFKPFEDLLVIAVSARNSRGPILDVGCGTGSTTLAVARVPGARGSTGIDISEPMIAKARVRAAQERTPATFIRADAQTHVFEPASFDMIISRFGVMFFDEFVAAFENLRRAARNSAELRFLAWRAPEENPFTMTAERAAAPLLPELPVRRPDEPGQFAFADARRVHHILERSGWAEADIRPIDVACTLPETELVRYFTTLGPVGRILHDVDERTRAQVIETLRAAFDPYVQGAEVRFTAACWMVSARASPEPPAIPK